MTERALREFERATQNMTVPIMMVLLNRVYDELNKDPCLVPVADQVGFALKMLFEMRDIAMETATEVEQERVDFGAHYVGGSGELC